MDIKVNLFGSINDHKFTTSGDGHIDPATGEAKIRLAYSSCPPEWNPLNYSDPLVLLAGYKEMNGARNFLSLSNKGYHAVSTIDFGSGLLLRKTATIRVENGSLVANYALFGAARVANIIGIEPYEEHMIPAGPGQIIAIGLARWKTSDNKTIEAVVSSRYILEENKNTLERPQIRRFEVKASLDKNGLEYTGHYNTSVTTA